MIRDIYMYAFLKSTPLQLFVSLLVIVGFFTSVQPVEAQGTAGVGIRPAIIEEQFEPGEIKQMSVQLNNLSGTDQTYYISRRDITGVREGGVPIFANDASELSGFEISEWITLDKTQVFIPKDGSAMVNFVLAVPENVSPGSHFGSIIVSVEPPEIRSSGASIGYEVANIISIRVAGETVESANIRQFSTSQYIYSTTNVDFEVKIQNEGNTLVKPNGPLEIKNMFGKQVALINFNESQAAIFPLTTRTFNQNWTEPGLGFGRYEALISLVYGEEGRKNTVSSTVTFWVLPMNIIGPAAGILAFVLLLVYFFIRLYVKRSVALLSAGSGRRLMRQRPRNKFPVVLLIVSMLSVTAVFLIILLLLFA